MPTLVERIRQQSGTAAEQQQPSGTTLRDRLIERNKPPKIIEEPPRPKLTERQQVQDFLTPGAALQPDPDTSTSEFFKVLTRDRPEKQAPETRSVMDIPDPKTGITPANELLMRGLGPIGDVPEGEFFADQRHQRNRQFDRADLAKAFAKDIGVVKADEIPDFVYLNIPEEKILEWQKGPGVGFWESMGKNWPESVPFNVPTAVKKRRIEKAAERLYKQAEGQFEYDSDKAQLEDENVFDAWLMAESEQVVRGVTTRGKIGRGIVNLPSYMIEFLVTGPRATQSKLAKLRRVQKAGKLARTGRIAATGARWMGTGLRRTTLMPHRVFGGAAERRLRDRVDITPQGAVYLNDVEESPAMSLFKAYGDVLIENMSETAGAGIGKVGSAILSKVAPRRMTAALKREFARLHPGKNINALFDRVGFHGFLEELGEERLGDLMRAVTGIEDFGAGDGADVFERMLSAIPDGEQWLVEMAVLSVPGTVRTVAGTISERGRKKTEAAAVQTQQINPESIKARVMRSGRAARLDPETATDQDVVDVSGDLLSLAAAHAEQDARSDALGEQPQSAESRLQDVGQAGFGTEGEFVDTYHVAYKRFRDSVVKRAGQLSRPENAPGQAVATDQPAAGVTPSAATIIDQGLAAVEEGVSLDADLEALVGPVGQLGSPTISIAAIQAEQDARRKAAGGLPVSRKQRLDQLEALGVERGGKEGEVYAQAYNDFSTDEAARAERLGLLADLQPAAPLLPETQPAAEPTATERPPDEPPTSEQVVFGPQGIPDDARQEPAKPPAIEDDTELDLRSGTLLVPDIRLDENKGIQRKRLVRQTRKAIQEQPVYQQALESIQNEDALVETDEDATRVPLKKYSYGKQEREEVRIFLQGRAYLRRYLTLRQSAEVAPWDETGHTDISSFLEDLDRSFKRGTTDRRGQFGLDLEAAEFARSDPLVNALFVRLEGLEAGLDAAEINSELEEALIDFDVTPSSVAVQKPISEQDVRQQFPKAKKIEVTGDPQAPGFIVILPNGQRILIDQKDKITADAAELAAAGIRPQQQDDILLAGAFAGPGQFTVTDPVNGTTLDVQGIIELADGRGDDTFSHEVFHAAWGMALTDQDRRVLQKVFGSEEAAADAYGTWHAGRLELRSNQNLIERIFTKIKEFAQQLLGLVPDQERVFRGVESGRTFEQDRRGTGRRQFQARRIRDDLNQAALFGSDEAPIFKDRDDFNQAAQVLRNRYKIDDIGNLWPKINENDDSVTLDSIDPPPIDFPQRQNYAANKRQHGPRIIQSLVDYSERTAKRLLVSKDLSEFTTPWGFSDIKSSRYVVRAPNKRLFQAKRKPGGRLPQAPIFYGDADFALIDEAVQEFGLTDDLNAAGYVLPNGNLLDFAAGSPTGQRWRDHRQISTLDGLENQDSGDLYASMIEFMKRTRAIRFGFDTGSLSVHSVGIPNSSQMRVIQRAINQGEERPEVRLDISEPEQGAVERTTSMDVGLMSEVVNFYENSHLKKFDRNEQSRRNFQARRKDIREEGVLLNKPTEPTPAERPTKPPSVKSEAIDKRGLRSFQASPKGAKLFAREPDEKITALAAQHFGLTQDPLRAGWILPDGRMLDLRGRDSHNDLPIAVRDAIEVKEQSIDYDPTFGMMKYTRAVRVWTKLSGFGVAESLGLPTQAQQLQIQKNSQIIKSKTKSIAVMGLEILGPPDSEDFRGTSVYFANLENPLVSQVAEFYRDAREGKTNRRFQAKPTNEEPDIPDDKKPSKPLGDAFKKDKQPAPKQGEPDSTTGWQGEWNAADDPFALKADEVARQDKADYARIRQVMLREIDQWAPGDKTGFFPRMARALGAAGIRQWVLGAAGVSPDRLIIVNERWSRSQGEAIHAAIVRMTHAPESGRLRWGLNTIQGVAELADVTFDVLRGRINKLSPEQQRDIHFMRGNPVTGSGNIAQREAFGRATEKMRQYAKALQEVYDTNYKMMQELDLDALYFNDYFYGAYKNPDQAQVKMSGFFRTTARFLKKKQLPTVADAFGFGLELRDINPVDNAARELRAILNLAAMRRLNDELQKTAYGTAVVKLADATEDMAKNWKVIFDRGRVKGGDKFSSNKEPTFQGLLVHPDVARMINNMIAVNKTSTGPLRVFRGIIHTLNPLKFLLPFFHVRTILAQAAVDSGVGGIFMPHRWFKNYTHIGNVIKDSSGREAYLRYIGLGGGHHFSLEAQGLSAFNKFVKGHFDFGPHPAARIAGGTVKFFQYGVRGVTSPFRGLQHLTFEVMIPAVKYAKFLEEQRKLESREGRPATDQELIKIIKVGQNFYGEMNERLFGRSATAISTLRFFFLAPGFREGNYRTMYRAASVSWDRQAGAGGRDWRSFLNIPQYLMFTFLLSQIGSRIMTGIWPEPPDAPDEPEDKGEPEDRLRDMFKIKTNFYDWKGRRIYIDLMTTDRDYYEQLVIPMLQLATGRPGEAAQTVAHEIVTTLGGMKSSMVGLTKDILTIVANETLVDWKGDQVYYITDPPLQKLNKIVSQLYARIEPIPASVLRNSLDRNVEPLMAFITATAGVRTGLSEAERKKGNLWRNFYAFRDQKDELLKVIRRDQIKPAQLIAFNANIDRVLEHKLVKADKGLSESLERVKLKTMKYYEISRLIQNYQDMMSVFADTYLAGDQGKAIILVKAYVKEHPDTAITADTLRTRLRNEMKTRNMTIDEKEMRRVPKALRGTVQNLN